MRDTIRGVPVGNRARERIGYLMRDAITSAWQSENSLSRQYHETVRSRRPATGRCVPRGVRLRGSTTDERDACEVHVPPRLSKKFYAVVHMLRRLRPILTLLTDAGIGYSYCQASHLLAPADRSRLAPNSNGLPPPAAGEAVGDAAPGLALFDSQNRRMASL